MREQAWELLRAAGIEVLPTAAEHLFQTGAELSKELGRPIMIRVDDWCVWFDRAAGTLTIGQPAEELHGRLTWEMVEALRALNRPFPPQPTCLVDLADLLESLLPPRDIP